MKPLVPYLWNRIWAGSRAQRRWQQLHLLRVLSDLREAMWAYVQIGISTLDVDFHAYGIKHLNRFLQNAKSTELQNWLKVVEG